MSNLVTVGISDLKVVKNPDRLITYALGSCVGICLYDAKTGVAGLSHILLPNSTECIQNDNKLKFADTAIPILINEMAKQGALKNRLVAKIAGGAQMFKVDKASGKDDLMNIGKRNVESVKKTLNANGIKIIAEDTGLNYGRTVEFSAENGIMTVKSLGKNSTQF